MILETTQNQNQINIKTDKGEKVISFPSKVRTVLKYQSSVLVLLDHDSHNYNDKNIFRIGEEGKNIWQIGTPDPYNTSEMSACFTYLGINKNDRINVGSMNGFNYEVDFETGKLLNKRFTK